MENQQKKTTLSVIDRFWLLLKLDGESLKNIYTFAIFSGLISLSLPLGIQAIVNLIQGGEASTSWVLLVFIVVLGVAIAGWLQILQMKLTEDLQQKIFMRAAFEFTYRIPKLRMDVLLKRYAPELMNRFFDTISVQKGLSKILIDFISSGFQVIFGLILLSFYHPFFIVYSLILAFLIIIILQFTLKKGYETSVIESSAKYQMAYWLEEIARSAFTFKLAGRTSLPLTKTNEYTDEYLDARQRHFKILVTQHVLMLIYKVLVVAGLLGIGGILVFEETMNIGQFIAAEIIILLIISSVDKFIGSIETIYDVLTAITKISQVTEQPLEDNEGVLVSESPFQGMHIEIQRRSENEDRGKKVYDFKSGSKSFLTNISEDSAIQLFESIAGIRSKKGQEILFNGLPVENFQEEDFRTEIGIFYEYDFIFQGTVFENISLGRAGITANHIQQMSEKIGFQDLFKQLPNGIQTPLSPINSTIPKNLIYQVLLLRAICGNPRLILLFNPLSNIAIQHHKQVLDFLSSEELKATVLVYQESHESGMKGFEKIEI